MDLSLEAARLWDQAEQYFERSQKMCRNLEESWKQMHPGNDEEPFVPLNFEESTIKKLGKLYAGNLSLDLGIEAEQREYEIMPEEKAAAHKERIRRCEERVRGWSLRKRRLVIVRMARLRKHFLRKTQTVWDTLAEECFESFAFCLPDIL